MNTTIRLAAPGDAAQIRDIYAPFVTDSAASFEIDPPTVSEMADRIGAILQTHPWLVCERGDEVLGYVHASAHRARPAYCWSVDVSVYNAPAHRRQGIGRALYTSLFSCLRLQGFYNAYAGITLPNPGSVGLHEAMGFELVGIYDNVGYKFGKWHDVGWWQMALQPHIIEPAPPIPLKEAIELEGWEAALKSGEALLS
jgi:phosphinothricin acetyltransferase